MATLYDYIASLEVNGEPVVWSNVPLSKSELDAAGRRPYIYVTEKTESSFKPLYDNVDVIQLFVNAHIFQPPDDVGSYPDKSDAMQLYFDLYEAPKHVDAWTYGQPLIDMFRDVAQPPIADEDTYGLYGHIRFRLLFPRG